MLVAIQYIIITELNLHGSLFWGRNVWRFKQLNEPTVISYIILQSSLSSSVITPFIISLRFIKIYPNGNTIKTSYTMYKTAGNNALSRRLILFKIVNLTSM